MAVISVGGYRFNILPNTASWSYSMDIKPIDTYGGRVVQLLACHIDNLSVEGYISPNGNAASQSDPLGQWQGMREFEYNVKSIMAYHESSHRSVQFDFPEVGWVGNVFLTGYSDVRYEPDIPAVSYRLSFDVDYGFDGIAAAAGDYGLKNIPDGVGWVRNVYNTPLPKDWETYKKAIAAILDDVGTFSASNPLDYYSYLQRAKDGEFDEDDGKSKAVAGDIAAIAAESVSPALGVVKGFMESHGITSSSATYGDRSGLIEGVDY